ncbi:SubName: Full=Uncharacterized protein {ECO:0000313/EMBL:CCA75221.1} [Serendipita indica DSM 11827]|uniref:COQ9 C-terminal domain-containing protein n=1 Tax=Serendipita indica (strain DSM 11827) TaxID=1109443 RepID=G4TV78_SERID|nr:SubName: Full=Uncharacterized protein {ECO:0000313/EMBL:CCA75221.1} [Serendipita indica DSM 11827]CCA75221.1 hypothetical protein PIIN_09205 [Serendipita indica DSM 11827]
MALRSQILRHAVTLVPSLGFTRAAISEAALKATAGEELPERTIDVLFGRGEDARKTLIRAWLEEGRNSMGASNHPGTVRDALHRRLEWNVPVLDKLPEAYALLATPSSLSPLDVRAILEHPAMVAHQACKVAQQSDSGMSWYTRRAALASAYAAAELHQLNSPATASGFLDGLLDASEGADNAVSEVATFAQYIGKSWIAIARSRGLLS